MSVSPDLSAKLPFGGPERVGTSNSYVWTAVVEALEFEDDSVYTFSVVALDAVGNGSGVQQLVDSEGHPLELRLDAAPPRLSEDVAVVFNSDRFGIPPDEGPPEVFSFPFVLVEAHPHELSEGEGGECLGICPRVRLGNKELGVVRVDEGTGDSPGEHAFLYSYEVDDGDWGEIDLAVSVTILWSDLAGNAMETTLPTQVLFDFMRPFSLDCQFTPDYAGAEDVLVYYLRADEPLGAVPELTVLPGTSGLFTEVPTGGVGETVFIWSSPAGGLPEGSYEVSAMVRDLAGNEAAAPLCPGSVVIDGTPPALAPEPMPLPDVTLFGPANGVVGFDFVVKEKEPVPLSDVDGECDENCPAVLLGGVALGEVTRKTSLDVPEEGLLGFHYHYANGSEDFALLDKTVEIAFQWSDKAGNEMSSEPVGVIRFDFVMPQVTDCQMLPKYANAGSTLSYSVTVSEELKEAPELVKSAGQDALFVKAPEVKGGGFIYTWQQAAADVAESSVGLSCLLVDLAGNATPEPLCELSVQVDVEEPQVVGGLVAAEPYPLDADGVPVLAVGDGDKLIVTFGVVENQALAAGFPEVLLDVPGNSVMFELKDSYENGEGEGGTTFEFELGMDGELHGAAEGNWPVRVAVQDEAGNVAVTPQVGDALARVDFTPPTADCALIPSAPESGYAIGEKVMVQVSPFEGLSAEWAPMVEESLSPPLAQECFSHDPDTAYRFSCEVLDSGADHQLSVAVRLIDLVGNETPEGETACIGGLLTAAFDGSTPQVQSVELWTGAPDFSDAPDGTYAAGTDFGVNLRIAGTEMEPTVFLGKGLMEAAGGVPSQIVDGVSEWWFYRTLDGSEGDGAQSVSVSGVDEAGNPFDYQSAGPLAEFDFQPPEAACFAAPSEGALGDVVSLSVTVSEPLLGGAPVVESTLPFGPPEVSEDQLKYTYTHLLSADDPAVGEWSYAVTLTDTAGNSQVGESACAGGGSLDYWPPEIAGGEEGIYVSKERVKDNEQFFIAFDLAEGTDSASAMVEVGGKPMAPAGDLYEADFVYAYTPSSKGKPADAEGYWPITIKLTDGAGNQNVFSPGNVFFDFYGPDLSGNASVVLHPPEGCPLGEVEALGAGAGLDVMFAVDEVLAKLPEVWLTATAAGGVKYLSPAPNSTADQFFYSYSLSAQQTSTFSPDVYQQADLKATFEDEAGNVVTHTLQAWLQVDTAPPLLPAVETPGEIIYSRVPFGSEATGGQPTFTLRGSAGSVKGSSHVLVYDGEVISQSMQVGYGRADDQWAFGAEPGEPEALQLSTADRPAVYIETMDLACNSSAHGTGLAERVREVEWIATLGGKVAGSDFENFNFLETRQWFGSGLFQGDAVEPEDGAVLGVAEGGTSIEGTGDWVEWTALSQTPSGRTTQGLAYDAQAERAVLFGGRSQAGWLQDTWSFDGTNWVEMEPVDDLEDGNPGARTEQAATFDRSRGRMVVYGGEDENQGLSDLWEFDGANWNLRPAVDPEGDGSPPRLAQAAMTYDSNRQVPLMFGGASSNPWGGRSDDLWAWNGTSWELQVPEDEEGDGNPSAREMACLVYDSLRDRTVLFGGWLGSDGWQMGDTWEWDGTSWHLIEPVDNLGDGNPQARNGSACVFDGEKVVLFGGRTDPKTYPADTWTWDGTEWELLEVTDPENDGNPLGRELGGAVWFEFLGKVLLAGGYQRKSGWNDEYIGDTWFFDGSSWEEWTPPDGTAYGNGIESMSRHRMSYDPATEVIWTFGGQVQPLSPWDQYEAPVSFDGRTWVRHVLPAADSPSPLDASSGHVAYNAAQAYDTDRNRMILFGYSGGSALYAYNRTWEWDGVEWEEILSAGDVPSVRSWSDLAYDSTRKLTVLFGGRVWNGEIFGDTWEYDGADWQLVQPEDPEGDGNPSPRFSHRMIFDPGSERVILMHGKGANAQVGQTLDNNGNFWAWDGASWEKLEAADPEGDGEPDGLDNSYFKHGYAVDYCAGRDAICMVGRCEGQLHEGVWEFDGASWRHNVPADPGGDGSPETGNGLDAAFHGTREELVITGGTIGQTIFMSGRTWSWRPGAEARPGVVARFDLGEAGIESEQITGMSTEWAGGGEGYPDGAAVPGASLLVFKNGHWVLVDEHQGGPDNPASLAWSAEDWEAPLLPLGDARLVGFAVAPAQPNGTRYGRVRTTYGELVVSYRLQ